MDTPGTDTLASALEFQAIVPLPFKITFLILLGIYLWWLLILINVKAFGINVAQLINFSYLAHDYASLAPQPGIDLGSEHTAVIPEIKENKSLLDGVWRQLKTTSQIVVVSFIIYHIFNVGRNSVIYFGSLANIVPFLAVCAVLYNLIDNGVSSSSTGHVSAGLARFTSTIKRVLQGQIASTTMRTNDILISDSLVSYNRVLNDVVLYLWIVVFGIDTPYGLVVEFVTCVIPVVIRMKQCWYEYRLSGGANRQHLLNFIKYTTNIPPLLVHLLTRRAKDRGELTATLSAWWYFFAAINSTYLFIWDVKFDWGLDWFALRPKRELISSPAKYHTAIGLDLVLRFVWLLRYFNYNSDLYLTYAAVILFGGTSHQCGYALLETLEILRRWMWCFMKLENDWVNVNK